MAERVLVLYVWVSGTDQSLPTQCQAPAGAPRREGTITLTDFDIYLRPQDINADAIQFGPFGAGCTAHDRAWSNVDFVSTIGAIPKASVEIRCQLRNGPRLAADQC